MGKFQWLFKCTFLSSKCPITLPSHFIYYWCCTKSIFTKFHCLRQILLTFRTSYWLLYYFYQFPPTSVLPIFTNFYTTFTASHQFCDTNASSKNGCGCFFLLNLSPSFITHVINITTYFKIISQFNICINQNLSTIKFSNTLLFLTTCLILYPNYYHQSSNIFSFLCFNFPLSSGTSLYIIFKGIYFKSINFLKN